MLFGNIENTIDFLQLLLHNTLNVMFLYTFGNLLDAVDLECTLIEHTFLMQGVS